VPPDFRDWIEGLGFPVTPIGPELRKLTAASPPATPAPLSPEVGIGTAHAPGTPTADSLTSALERTLQPVVAARARSVAAAVRSDGAQVAARRLVTVPT
jgi:vancomycin aglycone glucosyltransferase